MFNVGINLEFYTVCLQFNALFIYLFIFQYKILKISASALNSYNIPIIAQSAYVQKELNFKAMLH